MLLYGCFFGCLLLDLVRVLFIAKCTLPIKVQERLKQRPIVGLEVQSIAESTKLGWIFIFPGCHNEISNIRFSKTSQDDYENICSLVYLAIEDNQIKSDDYVYEQFRKQ